MTTQRRIRLPYINNAQAVLITLAINIGTVFLFYWPGGITLAGVMVDTVFCAAITICVDMFIVYISLKKMKASKTIPRQVPKSNLMQKLPKNPLVLGVQYFIVFGAAALGINVLILWFFGMQDMAFVPWLTYKLIYATVLSVKIIEFCIFRYVQPDWTQEEGPDASMSTEAPISTGAPDAAEVCGLLSDEPSSEEQAGMSVKNPLPKIVTAKEVYGSVTGNIALNIIIGSVLGGVVLMPDASVLISPITIQGIPISGFVFGLILGILVTNGVVKEMNSTIGSIGPSIQAGTVADRRISWMPKGRVGLTFSACVGTMAFSLVALPMVMALFGLSVMNFYQYTIFMTIYAALVSKPLSSVLVRRCMQPDYIDKVLGRQNLGAIDGS